MREAGGVRWLRALLLFVAVSHLAAGTGLAFSEGFQRWAVDLYGARVAWGPDTIYLIRIVGTFALLVGLVAAAAARRPAQHAGVVTALAFFFLLRSASRHLHWDEVRLGFRVGATTNLLTSAFFVLLAAALLVTLGWARRRESP